MQPSFPPSTSDRNQQTYLRHRREVFKQITIPLVIGIILIAVPALLITLGGVADLSTWANISIIWMIPPVFLFVVLFLIANAAFVYVLFRLIRVLPRYMKKAQDFLVILNHRVGRFSDIIVEPVIKASTLKSQVETLRNSILRK